MLHKPLPFHRLNIRRLFASLFLFIVLMIGSVFWHARCRAELVDRIVAIVNDDIILLSDYEQFIAPYREKLKMEGYSDAQLRIILADQQPTILDQMIEEKLTQQQAKRDGITVSDEEVDSSIKRFEQINSVSDDEMRRRLKMDGLTFDAFRNQVKEQLLQSKIVNREVKSKIVVTDDEVKRYYEENKTQYIGKTKYHLRHILMKVPPHSPDVRSRVYQQMQQIYERLKKGEKFTELAKVYSQSSTAEEGGDLGFFESRLLAEPVREALEGLTSGQYTPVIETEQGYQIFYIEELVDTGGKTLEEATPEIQDKLYSELVDQKFKAWFKDLRQKAHIQIVE